MLTKLRIRNFKRFNEAEIELGNPVIFIGPNDSGKTTALQALALWDLGKRRWLERYGDKVPPQRRPGVAINRRDLLSTPVPDASLLWHDLHVRGVKGRGRENIRVEVEVDGADVSGAWHCGFEFDYANIESLYCRALRADADGEERMGIPAAAAGVRTSFLPPMSGLAQEEPRVDIGRINVLIGEGRTAEVLRNLAYRIYSDPEGGAERWDGVVGPMGNLFGISLNDPLYSEQRGEVSLSYKTPSGAQLELSSAGRGLQQTLLLLVYLTANPGSVLLLDEPDAHLEILRQRQIYQVLSTFAEREGSQVVAASHSEVLLNEAADRDVVVAFLGRPHRIDDRGSQLLKSLKSIGFEQYYQAEQRGWVLYLEGATDLAILRAFAQRLRHPAEQVLQRPFVHYVGNQPSKAKEHFYGLREAKSDLVAYAVYDHMPSTPISTSELGQHAWSRNEIESYLSQKDTLLAWAVAAGSEQFGGPLFGDAWQTTMEKSISDISAALATLGKPDPWAFEVKTTDEFLDPLFAAFFRDLGLPNLLWKSGYHKLADFVDPAELDDEVVEVLDAISATAKSAVPAS